MEKGSEKNNILFLTLKKKWFLEIKSGKKKIEYREIKPYRTKRLFDEFNMPREFEYIIFKNGYSLDSPMIKIVLRKIRRGGKSYDLVLENLIA